MKSVYRDNKVVLITGGFMRKIARSSFRTESKRRLALRRLPVLIFFGSLGIAVTHRQFWRQLHCRPPAVQLLAQLPRQIPESLFFFYTCGRLRRKTLYIPSALSAPSTTQVSGLSTR